MGTDDGVNKEEVAVAATKVVKNVKKEEEKVEQETVPDTDKGDLKKREEDTKMPPPASAIAASGGSGAGGAGGASGAAGKGSGSAAIQAAVKAGNINIHQEERESRAPSLLVSAFCPEVPSRLPARVWPVGVAACCQTMIPAVYMCRL